MLILRIGIPSAFIAYLTKFSFPGDGNCGYEYIAFLYNSLNKQSCLIQVFVDDNDDRKINYDNAFNELIESVLHNGKKVSVETQKSGTVVQPVKSSDAASTTEFRHWLEQDFRSFLVKVKGLAKGTVSQYCQSVEAVEKYLIKNHPSLTLQGITAKQLKDVQKKLSYDWEYVEWNLRGHHQYSAALEQYKGFLKSGYKAKESGGEKPPLKEVIISVLTEAGRPMTITEIYDEIEKKQLYIFNSSNPRMIVNHAVRRSCAGIKLPDHTKEDAFKCVGEANGVSLYALVGQNESETVEREQVQFEKVPYKNEDSKPETESEDLTAITDYSGKQAEQIVLEADLDGIKVSALAEALKSTVAATKRIVEKNNNIIDICEKLIHKDAFVDWDQAADQLESILGKLMDKNNGYVSRSQLYDYARADMQMFMNDNDMDNAQKIYDMAVHLFAKEKYHGVEYSFSNLQHISKPQTGLSSVLDVILNYAREQGGFFNEDDLFSYLESVKIKTGNLRNGIMHVYDKPTFLFYDYHVFVLSECLRINNEWLSSVKSALDRLFADMGDHVILREIQPIWYAQLPSLPGDRPWTGILLQSVLLHYGKKLGGAKTIYAYQSLSGDYLQSMLVSPDSEVQSFNDAVIAVLVENEIEQREFESGELRQILIDRGLIGSTDLIGGLSKYIDSDERFVWSSKGQRVSIRI